MDAVLQEDEAQSPLMPDPTIPGPASRHYHTLDGLRGVAILMVFAYHAFIGLEWNSKWMRYLADGAGAGWLGVDVFFVLSGFLISGILLDSSHSSRYFRNFYCRRVLRIVPVYYLLLAIVFGVLPLFLSFNTPGLQIIKRNQAWLWLHATNWGFIWRNKVFTQSDWLDLNHLWSLAVEEQFYLFWPLVVWFLNRRWLKFACFACIIGSFLLRAALWARHMRNGALYFPTPCRLDGLAMGALVAIWLREKGNVPGLLNMARNVAFTAIAALLAVFIWRHGPHGTDSGNVVFAVTLAGVLTAAVIVLVAEPAGGGLLASVLGLGPLRTVGKYSYGLYLFHNVLHDPLARLIPPETLVRWSGNVSGNLLFVALFALVSWCAALISWHAYEKHWLKLKKYFDYKPAPAHLG